MCLPFLRRELGIEEGDLVEIETACVIRGPIDAPKFKDYIVDLGDAATKQFSAQYLRGFFDKGIEEGERLATEVNSQVGVS